jgi:hypothetical protein
MYYYAQTLHTKALIHKTGYAKDLLGEKME